jgi:hypothetical protein
MLGGHVALDVTSLADGDFSLGTDAPLDAAVDVQVVAQGKVADKL